MRSELLWIDLAILWVIIEALDFQSSNKRPPSQRELFDPKTKESIVNAWLTRNQVDRTYSVHISGNRQLTYSFEVLRRLGLLAEEGAYWPTEEGRKLFETLGREWQKWPLSIPIRFSPELDFSGATYAPEF